jgi:hypothetical protein
MYDDLHLLNALQQILFHLSLPGQYLSKKMFADLTAIIQVD